MSVHNASSVDKKTYPKWGTMITVHDGAHQSFPLHPEHQAAIKKLSPGASTSFRDETGRSIRATREDDHVILTPPSITSNRSVKVKHSVFNEEVEQVDELSRKTLGSYAKQAVDDIPILHKIGDEDMRVATNRDLDFDLKKYVTKRGLDSYRKAHNREKGVKTAITKLTKEDVIRNTLNKYNSSNNISLYETLNNEEKLVYKLEGLEENHIITLLNLYRSLSESNQIKMLNQINDLNDVEELLDFAIQNRE